MPSVPRPANTGNSASVPLRILMIHGYTQSGSLFRAKTRALEKKLLKAFPAGVSLVYPTAPIRLTPADVPGFSPLTSTATSEDNSNAGNNNSNNNHANLSGASSDSAQASSTAGPTPSASAATKPDDTDTDGYGWWRRRGDTEPYYYEGMELGLDSLARTLKEEGPFDGVIGFSQGGSAAGLVASLLEPGRRRAFEDAARHRDGMKLPEAFWSRRTSKGRRKGTTEGSCEAKDKDCQTAEVSGAESLESKNDALASEESNKTAATESTAQNQVNSHPATTDSSNPNSNPNSNLEDNTDTNEEEDKNIYEPIHPPLKFAVSYSGYGTLNPLYAGFFNPRIRTPMLHFIGSLDTVVEERRSLMLVDACEEGGGEGREEGLEEGGRANNRRVIYHPGGHFLPSSQKQLVGALVGFIREAMATAAAAAAEQKDEKAQEGKNHETHNNVQVNDVRSSSTEVDEGMQHLGLHGERNAHI